MYVCIDKIKHLEHYLFLLLLSVSTLFPLYKDWVNEVEVPHVESEQSDDTENHADHNLDDDSVPLLVTTHTPGTEGVRQVLNMILNIETWDDNIETVTVAEIVIDS